MYVNLPLQMRRTEAEAQATRVALRQAALSVFAERGYAAARLEEIAERAGLTRGALYHHYGGKAGLYTAVVGETWQEVAGPVFAELDGDGPPLERLERFLVAYVRGIDEVPRFRELLAVVTLGTEVLPELEAGLEEKRRALELWLAELERLMAEAKRRGELRGDLRPRHAALAVLCFLNGVSTTAATTPGLVSPRVHARPLARVAIEGLKP
jgi:AcrR family transcriptional regulator